MANIEIPSYVKNEKAARWVREMAALCKPDSVHWCDGSPGRIRPAVREAGPGRHLHPAQPGEAAELLPGAFRPGRRGPRRGPHLHLQRKAKRRRPDQQLGGPGGDESHADAASSTGCMRGRTMYVIPFSMGPLGSPIAHIGIELTDSPYVVVNMRIMTRMGRAVWDVLGNGEFVPCLHSVGAPLAPGQKDVPGRATRTTNTSSTSRKSTPSGPSAAATAATRCWARSASPCASLRPWPATRAGWPSIC